eukprot:XP_791356.3 PREDICTED: osteoclast-stimulating factor 1 [Strongylocentrotus purpuratus]
MSTPSRPAPPRPQPKPGQVKVFRSLYAYTALQSDELTFEEGDLLYVTEMTNDGWWKGRCGTKSGLIPGNYVEESTESVDFPLHEAAKRGNLSFIQECISNKSRVAFDVTVALLLAIVECVTHSSAGDLRGEIRCSAPI